MIVGFIDRTCSSRYVKGRIQVSAAVDEWITRMVLPLRSHAISRVKQDGAQALARRRALSHSDHFQGSTRSIEPHNTLRLPVFWPLLEGLTYTHDNRSLSPRTPFYRKSTLPDQGKRSRDCASTRQNQQDYKEREDGTQQGKGRKSGLHWQHPIRSVYKDLGSPRQQLTQIYRRQ